MTSLEDEVAERGHLNTNVNLGSSISYKSYSAEAWEIYYDYFTKQ